MSAANKMLQLSPCSSGKSASFEPGSPWNKGLVSCLQAISSRTQPAEMAETSKIPCRGEANPPASKCNKVHPAQYPSKNRPEHAEESELNGSTHGEASKQTRSQYIMMKMKQFFSKTNTKETLASKCPTRGEIQDDLVEGTITVPHFFMCDSQSSDSEEDEHRDDLIASWQDTLLETETVSLSSTASSSLSPSTHSLHSLQTASSLLSASAISDGKPVSNDEYSLTPVLERTREPRVAAPSTDSVNNSPVVHTPSTDQQFPELQSSWRTSHMSLASPLRSSFCQRRATLVTIQEDAVHEGTSATEDTLQAPNENWHQGTSRWLELLNMEDVSSDNEEDTEHIHVCGGANAQVLHSPNDSNKELVLRPKQRLLDESSNEEGQCRICHSGDNSPANPLLTPCLCSGSLRFIHLDCLKNWIRTRVQSGSRLYIVERCELCTERLTLDPNTFDWDEFFPLQDQQQLDDDTLVPLLEPEVLIGQHRFMIALIAQELALRNWTPTELTPLSSVFMAAILLWSRLQRRINLRRLRMRLTMGIFTALLLVFYHLRQ